MPFFITNEPERQVLKLQGVVTIDQARQLAAMLVEGLDNGKPVAVDTGGLEDIDTCMLQLLHSLRKTVPALSIVNPSEAFINTVERCGLRRELLGFRERFCQ